MSKRPTLIVRLRELWRTSSNLRYVTRIIFLVEVGSHIMVYCRLLKQHETTNMIDLGVNDSNCLYCGEKL